MQFILDNWGTIVVAALVLGVIALVIVKLRRDKARGKSSCGCACGDCPAAGACHKK